MCYVDQGRHGEEACTVADGLADISGNTAKVLVSEYVPVRLRKQGTTTDREGSVQLTSLF